MAPSGTAATERSAEPTSAAAGVMFTGAKVLAAGAGFSGLLWLYSRLGTNSPAELTEVLGGVSIGTAIGAVLIAAVGGAILLETPPAQGEASGAPLDALNRSIRDMTQQTNTAHRCADRRTAC